MATLEERVTVLEQEVARLIPIAKRKLPEPAINSETPWYEFALGQFENDVDHLEAMRLGREWRDRTNRESLVEWGEISVEGA